MRPEFRRYNSISLWQLVLIASLVGGLAEIIWVSLYASFTSLTAAAIAREVTASLLPIYSPGVGGALLGLLIHMLLSIALGFAFAYVLWKPFVRSRGIVATLVFSVLTLASVWAINFFVVLPSLNPLFIELMPYTVTFASKMLFALVMAVTLAWPELHMTKQNRVDNMHRRLNGY